MRFAAQKLALPLLLASLATASAHAAANKLSAAERATGWKLLFDGKSLDGWKANENPDTFKVVKGEIVVHGARSHLFYVGPVQNHDFKNFELKATLMTFPQANSGIYFHTQWQDSGWPAKGYEAQVNNSYPRDPSRTGGLFAVQDNHEPPVRDNTWFTIRIRVEGQHITTWVDDRLISDYTEGEPSALDEAQQKRLLPSGTFALQGHDPGSEVHYRDIKVLPLP